MARETKGDPFVSCSLSAIFSDTIAICRERFLDAGVELACRHPRPDVFISCRSAEIGQVLLNLLDNAFDAACDRPQQWVKVDCSTARDMAVISVTDSGPGVSQEVRERIHEPFFTTKEVGKGTGLGLSISRSIVDSHKGSLWLDDSCGHTRFAFSVPLAPSEETDQREWSS
jgi:signal transduction histidine kinase